VATRGDDRAPTPMYKSIHIQNGEDKSDIRGTIRSMQDAHFSIGVMLERRDESAGISVLRGGKKSSRAQESIRSDVQAKPYQFRST
jgi:hypothetical protein